MGTPKVLASALRAAMSNLCTQVELVKSFLNMGHIAKSTCVHCWRAIGNMSYHSGLQASPAVSLYNVFLNKDGIVREDTTLP